MSDSEEPLTDIIEALSNTGEIDTLYRHECEVIANAVINAGYARSDDVNELRRAYVDAYRNWQEVARGRDEAWFRISELEDEVNKLVEEAG